FSTDTGFTCLVRKAACITAGSCCDDSERVAANTSISARDARSNVAGLEMDCGHKERSAVPTDSGPAAQAVGTNINSVMTIAFFIALNALSEAISCLLRSCRYLAAAKWAWSGGKAARAGTHRGERCASRERCGTEP